MEKDPFTAEIIGCAIEVHRALGPGLLESTVDDRLILELKAVEHVKGIHKAQLLTYMRLSGIATGLLINFHDQKLADGFQRFKL